MGGLTFWEETGIVVHQVAAEKPSIAELVVPFDQLDPIALGEAKLVGAPGIEIIYSKGKSRTSAMDNNFATIPRTESWKLRCQVSPAKLSGGLSSRRRRVLMKIIA